jgi:hypothetical protein
MHASLLCWSSSLHAICYYFYLWSCLVHYNTSQVFPLFRLLPLMYRCTPHVYFLFHSVYWSIIFNISWLMHASLLYCSPSLHVICYYFNCDHVQCIIIHPYCFLSLGFCLWCINALLMFTFCITNVACIIILVWYQYLYFLLVNACFTLVLVFIFACHMILYLTVIMLSAL